MLIVDKDIHTLIDEGKVLIFTEDEDYPFIPSKQVTIGSIDLRLSNKLLRYKKDIDMIDLTRKDLTESFVVPYDKDFLIQPNEIILATTHETVCLPPDIAGFIAGRSSISRLGLLIHVSQEYMLPGHRRLVPLQLVNITNHPIKIKPLLPICQILLVQASTKAGPYQGKYEGELTQPLPSKISEEISYTAITPTENKAQGEIDLKIQALENKIKTSETEHKNALSNFKESLSGIMLFAYFIVGICVSLFLQEVDVKPFPSLTLILSAILGIFCLIIIGLGRRKKTTP